MDEDEFMDLMIEKSWFAVLQKEMQKPYILELKNFLQSEQKKGCRILPPPNLIFHAFRCTPYEKVKVVIVGQDPYHGINQAHGLCFSVQKGISIPPSLNNIYKELKEDLNIPLANHGCLEKWSRQGVLLLNATLTVREKEPKSHYGKGWERFTDSVIRTLCLTKDFLVFLLWGRSAQEKCRNILDSIKHPHKVLISAHPSPYSAQKFFGCRHFSKTNEFLQKKGKQPIDWSLDNLCEKGF